MQAPRQSLPSQPIGQVTVSGVSQAPWPLQPVATVLVLPVQDCGTHVMAAPG